MKDIKGWEGKYAITRIGKVWARPRIIIQSGRWGGIIERKWKGHWIATHSTKNNDWYYSVALAKKNRKGYKIHRLVAEAFIPNPLNLPEVNHKNGNKGDNRIENLEWCTRAENLAHGRIVSPMANRKIKRGTQSPHAKLTEAKVLEIRKIYIPFDKSFGSRAL